MEQEAVGEESEPRTEGVKAREHRISLTARNFSGPLYNLATKASSMKATVMLNETKPTLASSNGIVSAVFASVMYHDEVSFVLVLMARGEMALVGEEVNLAASPEDLFRQSSTNTIAHAKSARLYNGCWTNAGDSKCSPIPITAGMTRARA